MKYINSFIILFIVVNSIIECVSGNYNFGKCEPVPLVNNFNVDQFFTGKWYHYMSFGDTLIRPTGYCATMDNKIYPDGELKSITYFRDKIRKTYLLNKGFAKVKDIKGPVVKLNYKLFDGFVTFPLTYQIIDTDYDNYALLYYCQPTFIGKIEMAWMLTRTRGDNSNESKMRESFHNAGLNPEKFKKNEIENCPPNEPSL